jgi:hypothetical protein
MGGSGSGRFGWLTPVEHCRSLDAGELIRARTERGITSGRVTFSRGEAITLRVEYRLIDGPGPGETAIGIEFGCGGSPYRQAFSLFSEEPYLRGRRWWFRCPTCSRKVAQVYQRPEGGVFACRTCHGLTYRSRQRRGRPWFGRWGLEGPPFRR